MYSDTNCNFHKLISSYWSTCTASPPPPPPPLTSTLHPMEHNHRDGLAGHKKTVGLSN